MKKLITAVVLSASIFGLAACSSDNADSDVIVKTNVGDITKEEYYTELDKMSKGQLLQSMIIVKVLEDKYDVSEKEIDQRIEQFKLEQGDQYQMWLMQMGIADEKDKNFRKEVRTLVLQEKVQYEGIEVSDDEVKAKYDEMKENRQIEINASHILVDDEKEAKDIKKQLDDGADFAELAKKYSKDGSAERGGELGFFSSEQNKMIEEFEDAAYALKVGEISDPVKSENGYHIITVTEIPTFEDKEEQVRMALLNEKIDPQELQGKLDKMLKEADIDIKIKEYKDLFQFEDVEPDKENNSKDNAEKNSGNEVEENSAE